MTHPIRSDDSDQTEIARLRAALSQVTEQHDRLTGELAAQYRLARQVGWLPPHVGVALTLALSRARGHGALDESTGEYLEPLDARRGLEKVRSILEKESRKRAHT